MFTNHLQNIYYILYNSYQNSSSLVYVLDNSARVQAHMLIHSFAFVFVCADVGVYTCPRFP